MTLIPEDLVPVSSKNDQYRITRFIVCWIRCYLFIYIAPFPIGTIPWTGWASTAFESIKQSTVVWLASNLFSVSLTTMPNGSGDTTYNYFEVAFMLALALIASVVSGFVPKKQRSLLDESGWLRVAVRYYLAAAMLGYGWHKLLPIQFSNLGPDDVLTTYGDSSPMGLLWRFMGASTVYQMFAGTAEVAGGLLLLFRRTTLIGALISGGILVNVVMLNFCFDVPVKLYSSHLLFMAVWLASADLPRLMNFFVFNRTVAPAKELPGPATHYVGRIGYRLAKATFCFLIGVLPAVQNWQYLFSDGPWRTRSERHGVYNVEFFERDGIQGKDNEDRERWVRVGLNDWGIFTIQYANGRSLRFRMEINEKQHKLVLTQRSEPLKHEFEMKENSATASEHAMELSGVYEQAHHRIRIVRSQETSFFESRGFHWINEYPLNR